ENPPLAAASLLGSPPRVAYSLPSLFSSYSKTAHPTQETDQQLLYMERLLSIVHTVFFDLCEKRNLLTENSPKDRSLRGESSSETFSKTVGMTEKYLPSVASLLEAMRKETLRGITLTSSGLRCPLFPLFKGMDFGHLAACFGAKIQENYDETVTHLLCFGCTDRYVAAEKAGIPTLHLMWLEFAFYTWSRPDDSLFSYSKCFKNYHSFWDVLKDIPVPQTLHEEIVQSFRTSADLPFQWNDSNYFQIGNAASSSGKCNESLSTRTQDGLACLRNAPLSGCLNEEIYNSSGEQPCQSQHLVFQTSDALSENSDTEALIWGDFWDQLQNSTEDLIEEGN
ncbi:hypothetical protein IE077_002873, partial [Cardiosporidium cionae]